MSREKKIEKSRKKIRKNFAKIKKSRTFASSNRNKVLFLEFGKTQKM